jgi:hypothetical protein
MSTKFPRVSPTAKEISLVSDMYEKAYNTEAFSVGTFRTTFEGVTQRRWCAEWWWRVMECRFEKVVADTVEELYNIVIKKLENLMDEKNCLFKSEEPTGEMGWQNKIEKGSEIDLEFL